MAEKASFIDYNPYKYAVAMLLHYTRFKMLKRILFPKLIHRHLSNSPPQNKMNKLP